MCVWVCVGGLLFPPLKAFYFPSWLLLASSLPPLVDRLFSSLYLPHKNHSLKASFFWWGSSRPRRSAPAAAVVVESFFFFKKQKKKDAFLVACYILTHQSFFHCCWCECRFCCLCYELFGFGLCLVCLLFRIQSVKGFSFCGVFAFKKCF